MTRRQFACACACAFAIVAGLNAQSTVQINGAGATLPFPLYAKWFSEYQKLHPDIQINYQSIGSGGGIRQIQAETVFFGATDGPMTDKQLQAAPRKVLHLPTNLGAVVVIDNLPGNPTALRFSGPVLADIFLGRIAKWNDAAIARLNPGVALPDTDITVAHRADGSGTTYIWVDYLSKVSPDWKSAVGVNTSVRWPTGIGGRGTEGVAGLVRQVPGSIGYVELIYALQNTLSYGAIQNEAGEFIKSVERVGNSRRRVGREPDARGLPGVDHERARPRRVPDLIVYLDVAVRGGQPHTVAGDGGFSEMGAHRGPAVLRSAGIRAPA